MQIFLFARNLWIVDVRKLISKGTSKDITFRVKVVQMPVE